jgi:hypothetical protein
MKKSFPLFEQANKEVGLVINEGKTKYTSLVATNIQKCSKTRANERGRHNFKRFDSFTYLS